METYPIQIGRLTRDLPIVDVAPGVRIALFVSLGDYEICQEAARLLAERLPEADLLLTAETKGIAIAHALAGTLNLPRYAVARKSAKPYMNVKLMQEVHTISTQSRQVLYLDEADQKALENQRVILIDDVISTGDSLKALESLAERAGAKVVARAAILSEGAANDREDIICLESLPLF